MTILDYILQYAQAPPLPPLSYDIPYHQRMELTENVLKPAFYGRGIQSENGLTDFLFAHRHPELPQGYRIPGDNRAQQTEWRTLKDQVVRPFLQSQSAHSTPSPSATSAPAQLGVLTIDINDPALRQVKRIGDVSQIKSYRFTAEDALWLARMVEGEAGFTIGPDLYAVVWAMFNRFALLRQNAPGWKGTFHVFLRLYSTPLQYFLASCDATERVYAAHKKGAAIEQGEKIVCNGLKQVQYTRHREIQQKPWEKFGSKVQQTILDLMTGKIPNPGIGLATEFASSWEYFLQAKKLKDEYGAARDKAKFKEQYRAQWEQYTREVVTVRTVKENKKKVKKKIWTWIGPNAPNLNQMKNAFFIDDRFLGVPESVVKITPP